MILALLASATPSFAGCKLNTVGPDPLTGNRIDAAPLRLGTGWLLEVDHHSVPTGPMKPWVVAWVFVQGGAHQEVLSVGDTTIQFALASGTKIEGSLVAEVNPVPQAVSGVVITQYTAVFALTDEDVATLAASPITFVRVNRGANAYMSYDATTNRKNAWEAYPAQVQCLRDAVMGT